MLVQWGNQARLPGLWAKQHGWVGGGGLVLTRERAAPQGRQGERLEEVALQLRTRTAGGARLTP